MAHKLDKRVVAAMRDRGAFRNDGYALKDGFAGDYKIEKTVPFKSRGSEANDNYSIHCKTQKGMAVLSAGILGNARLISDVNLLQGKSPVAATAKDIYFAEDVRDVIESSVVFNSVIDDNEPVLPDEFKVVGAIVTKDAEGKPTIPLRRYRYYNQVLKHHRKELGDEAAFMTREEFANYLTVEGDKRPAGIPETYNAPQLVAGVKVDDPASWTFTLLVADKK